MFIVVSATKFGGNLFHNNRGNGRGAQWLSEQRGGCGAGEAGDGAGCGQAGPCGSGEEDGLKPQALGSSGGHQTEVWHSAAS